MDEQYFCVIDRERNGPVSFAALRELAVKGELKRCTKLWCQVMKEWLTTSVPQLFEGLPPDLKGVRPRKMRKIQDWKLTKRIMQEMFITVIMSAHNCAGRQINTTP
jgi:hypothetical protein